MFAFCRAVSAIKSLRRATSGNVAIMFAVAVTPIMVVVSASIEYTRAAMARSAMQAAADATSLMVAKTASTMTAAQIQTQAQKYFLANLLASGITGINVNATYTSNSGTGSSVQITANGNVDSVIGAAFLGRDTMPVSTSSTVTWGNARMRIALSLDNTGSMADVGKIVALRDAVTKFIDDMSKQAKKPGDVLISIVPFAKDVNVGATNKSENWVSLSSWDETSGYCSGLFGSYFTTKTSCKNASRSWTVYNKNLWQGCVTDRDQPYDIQKDPPTSNATDFPAEYYASCGSEMMPLSSDWLGLKAKVATMLPGGNTNQPIGLAIAWQTLLMTSPWPAPAKASDATYLDIIIHLSDGENTQNRWSSSVSAIDARQASLCDNIKASQVTVYMVQVNTDGDPAQAVMKNCATSADKYYMLTSGSQTVAVFSDIAAKISALRISQ